MPAPARGYSLRLTLLALLAIGSSSCTVLQAPVSTPVVSREDTFHGSLAGLEIDAVPVRTWDANWALFEDFLPEVGLLPVWIELRNDRRQEVDLGSIEWKLEQGATRLSVANLNDIFKIYYKRRHIRMYSLNADREARKAMSKWLMPEGPLAASQTLKGFVFFRSKTPQTQEWTRGCVLIARGLPDHSGARGKETELEIPLFHANP